MERETLEEDDSELSSFLALVSSPPTPAGLHGLRDHLGNTALSLQDFYLFQ